MKTGELEKILKILEREYKKWDVPVVTMIAERTHDPWKILVSTVLSGRTKDEVTWKASERLFSHAKTPEELLSLPVKTIEKLIYPVGFYRTKARRLKELARAVVENYKGKVPDNLDELLKLPGVGRKTANLVLIHAFDKDGVCVDTHVHRISNLWGFVKTKTPEETEFELRKKLPRKWWKLYNDILVAFGQAICRPVKPRCEECPVKDLCPVKSRQGA
ncbi:endonuclease III [bacterium]|nr:MAG: endonuclease III [bacterium]